MHSLRRSNGVRGAVRRTPIQRDFCRGTAAKEIFDFLSQKSRIFPSRRPYGRVLQLGALYARLWI